MGEALLELIRAPLDTLDYRALQLVAQSGREVACVMINDLGIRSDSGSTESTGEEGDVSILFFGHSRIHQDDGRGRAGDRRAVAERISDGDGHFLPRRHARQIHRGGIVAS